MILPITQYGNPVLAQKGARVDLANPALKPLIADMIDTMRVANGVGLAAHQVGVAINLAVVDVSRSGNQGSWVKVNGNLMPWIRFMPLVLINPEIKASVDMVSGSEGCLSMPNVYASVSRPASVFVDYTSLNGKQKRIECGGYLARAVQHEYDHLQGIMFISRLSDERREEVLQKYLTSLEGKSKLSSK